MAKSAKNEGIVPVGAIWNRVSKAGNDYLGISVDLAELLKALGYEPPEGLGKVNLSAFVNSNKTEEKQPDFRINYFLK